MNLFSKIFVIFLIVLGFFYFKNNVVDNFLNSKIDNVKNGTNKKLPDEIEKNNKNNAGIDKKTEKIVINAWTKHCFTDKTLRPINIKKKNEKIYTIFEKLLEEGIKTNK